MSPEGETEVVLEKPRRAPRKRAPKAVLSDDAATSAPVKRAPRKRAPKKIVEEKDEPKKTRTPTRKAPTPIAAEKAKTKRGRKNATVVLILLLLGVGSSAAVGFTDKGQIDVAATITRRNEEAKASGQTGLIIPVQNSTQEPNGGLIGVGDVPTAAPQASSTPATASSTEATASSTEEAVSTETASTT